VARLTHWSPRGFAAPPHGGVCPFAVLAFDRSDNFVPDRGYGCATPVSDGPKWVYGVSVGTSPSTLDGVPPESGHDLNNRDWLRVCTLDGGREGREALAPVRVIGPWIEQTMAPHDILWRRLRK